MDAESTEPTPTDDTLIPDELVADVESAFAKEIVLVPDSELIFLVDALHAFLDAGASNVGHDAAMMALHSIKRPEEGAPVEPAFDAVRHWCTATTRYVLATMTVRQQSSAMIWVYHETLNGREFPFRQWRLTSEGLSYSAPHVEEG